MSAKWHWLRLRVWQRVSGYLQSPLNIVQDDATGLLNSTKLLLTGLNYGIGSYLGQ